MKQLGRALARSHEDWLDRQPDGPRWVEYTLPCGDTFVTDTPLRPGERVWCQSNLALHEASTQAPRVHGWQQP